MAVRDGRKALVSDEPGRTAGRGQPSRPRSPHWDERGLLDLASMQRSAAGCWRTYVTPQIRRVAKPRSCAPTRVSRTPARHAKPELLEAEVDLFGRF